MTAEPEDPCRDLDRRSVDADLAATGSPADGQHPVPTAPGARDHTQALALRLCRIMTAVSIRAGNAGEPSLSAAQIRVLTMLAAAESGLSLTSVADCLGATNSATSRVCARLVDAGLIEREPGPGNEIRLSLSAAGADLLAEVNRDRLGRITTLLDNLTPPECATVLQAMELLAQATAGHPDSW